jgi:asparagine synthase (glutamine-hydrolysing)
MCGIAGILNWAPDGTELPLVEAMTACIAHRGPNDSGVLDLGPLTLGHRRLSILDTSSAGHQPMWTPDGRYLIVHNGEIYNFLELADELRARGHAFHTASDTEVILEAYREWGPDCVTRFNGMWAFMLWDIVEETLFLSRDRFGVKPLYLAESNGRVAYASELKALLQLPWVSHEPDVSAVRDFLLDGSVDQSAQTFFRQIQRLPAAHSLLISRQSRRLARYWTPPYLSDDASSRPDPGDRERVDEIRALLIDSVALRLRSDVALGSCLSGGLDSSTIVSIAAGLRSGEFGAAPLTRREREASPQLVFFAEFRESGIDERPYVDAVVEATGIALRTTTPSSGSFINSLDEIVWHQDEPFGSTSIVAQHHVMKLARESGVTVLLDGQGADETFGGYAGFVTSRLSSAIRQGEIGKLVRLPGLGPRESLRALRDVMRGTPQRPTKLAFFKPLTDYVGDRVRRAERLEPDRTPLPGTLLGQILWDQVSTTSLPSLLRYEDRSSMTFSIEARVPYLDYRIVEAALALPDRLRVQDDLRKVALQRAAIGIAPAAVLARRDKVAFQTPQGRWLREAQPIFAPLLGESYAEADGYLLPGAVERTYAAFAAGRLDSNSLWRILSLELWLRRVVHDQQLTFGRAEARAA